MHARARVYTRMYIQLSARINFAILGYIQNYQVTSSLLREKENRSISARNATEIAVVIA